MEEAIRAMLERMRDEYVASSLPLDAAWRHVQYGAVSCRPTGLVSGGSGKSPLAFVEAIKQVWLQEGYLRAFQQAWLADRLMDDLTYAKSFDLWRTSNGLLERVARIALIRLLDHDPEPVRDEEIRAFANDLRSQSQRFVTVTPISGVSAEDGPLLLSPQVTVRCLSPIEHDFLVNSKAFNFDQRAVSQWWRYPTVIETRLDADFHRHLKTRMDEAASIVRIARVVLSVCTDINVYTPGLFCALETGFPVLINRSELSSAPVSAGYLRPRPLDDVARERIAAMWAAHENARGGVRVAIGRLAFLIDRQEPIDLLIDAWVALEAMFTGARLKGELRYRLAFRIASFVGVSALRRQQVFDLLYDSYDVRSRLVHGDKKQPSGDKLDRTVHQTVSIARECVFRFVTSVEVINPDDLDSKPFLA